MNGKWYAGGALKNEAGNVHKIVVLGRRVTYNKVIAIVIQLVSLC